MSSTDTSDKEDIIYLFKREMTNRVDRDGARRRIIIKQQPCFTMCCGCELLRRRLCTEKEVQSRMMTSTEAVTLASLQNGRCRSQSKNSSQTVPSGMHREDNKSPHNQSKPEFKKRLTKCVK